MFLKKTLPILIGFVVFRLSNESGTYNDQESYDLDKNGL